jgi:Domain of unknown function (DUF5979)
VGPYLVTVNWTDVLGETISGVPVAVELVPNEPEGRPLPIASTCTFTERDVPERVTVTYNPNADGTAGEVVIPSEEDIIVTVSITNTFTTGSLVIEKEVSGPGAPDFTGGPFVFGVSCDYLGVEDVYSVASSFQAPPTGRQSSPSRCAGIGRGDEHLRPAAGTILPATS